jgi:DNA transformation protein and related proteins
MPVTDTFRDFIIEQLEQCARDIRAKRMFGAVGIYSGEYFFAVIDEDRLYFKVDDQTRPKFEAENMEPARIVTKDGVMTLGYYEVPIGVLEAPDDLRTWVRDAVAVAERARLRKRPRKIMNRRSKI